MGLFGKKTKETEIWEDFGVTEAEWDRIDNIFRHADIDSKTYIDFAKNLFPKSKEDQIKAFIFWHKGRSDLRKQLSEKKK